MFIVSAASAIASANICAEDIPEEAFQEARAFLDKLIKAFQDNPEAHQFVLRKMKIEDFDDLNEAEIGIPCCTYRILTESLKYIHRNGNNISEYADLAYYSFPIIIDGQPRGMINGRMKEDDWTFGFRVLTKLQSRVHQLKAESKNPHLFDSFYLNIDTTGIFAIITESGQAYIIPANHHSANMINVRKQKHGGYDSISFSSAYDLLMICPRDLYNSETQTA